MVDLLLCARCFTNIDRRVRILVFQMGFPGEGGTRSQISHEIKVKS